MARSDDISSIARVNILLVDDQPADLSALEATLADLDQILIKAESGEEALRRLANAEFAVVVLDVRAPGLDGLQTARRIRAREQVGQTPILFLTAQDAENFPLEEAYRLAAVDCLARPYIPAVLKAKVAGLVELFQRTQQLMRQVDKLEHRVQERTADLVHANEALREGDRLKDQLLAMLAHELRNPLAPLLTSLQVLQQAGALPQAREESTARMERQIRHLARLVDDLLDVSHLTYGKIRLCPERLDWARLVRATAEERRATLEQTGLTLAVETPEIPLWVRGDPARLRQVVVNLLDNAQRFTDRGGDITVAVRAEAAQGKAVLTVRDTGIGIQPEMHSRLFKVFAQADQSLGRKRGGLGLGLALVQGLVDLHGGEVQAASAGPGCGSEFAVRLPLEKEPPALAGQAKAHHVGGQKRRVLVVDDNRDATDSLRMFLELAGHEVRTAYTGPEGVHAAFAWRPDLVLCDLGLPGLDGFGVAKALRRNPVTAKTPLIAVTGYGAEEDRRRAREAGFDRLLTKPADPVAVETLVARA